MRELLLSPDVGTEPFGASDTLQSVLRRNLQRRGDKPAITVLRRHRPALDLSGTYLLAQAAALASRWDAHFGPGPHRFILAFPAGADFLIAMLASLLSGNTMIPVATPRAGSRADRLTHIAKDCRATAILCVAEAQESLNQFLREQVSATRDTAPPLVTAIDDDWRASPITVGSFGEDTDCQPAIIQYTSGSTRHPKGVLLGGKHVLANCSLVARTCSMDHRTRFVNWLPHHHDMGLMGGVLYPLLTDSYSVQMNPLDMVRKPINWLKAITEYRATFSGGPAFAFADCLTRIADEEVASLDLSSWERAFCGAEPVPAGLLPAFRQRFAARGLRPEAVYGCYGMAESTLYVAGAPEDHSTGHLQTASDQATQACRLTETTRPWLRIVDPVSRECVPSGARGEIWVSGPSCGYGYLGLPDETESTFNAELAEEPDRRWLRTGDLGIICGDNLWIVGRIKDTIIANGRKLSAAELEWLAAEAHEALNPLAAAAFQVSESGSAEAVLYIELKPHREAPECLETVCASIQRRVLGEWGVRLVDIHVVPRGVLDRTTSGKIRRQMLASSYRKGNAPAGLNRRLATVAEP